MLKFGKIAAIFCLCLLCLLALTPLALSTSLGTKLLVGYVNKTIPGSFEVERTYFSWFGKQSFHDISLNNREGDLIVKVKKIEVDAPFFSLLMNRNNFHQLQIEETQAKITQDRQGVTDLQDALGLKKMASKKAESPVFIEKGEVKITLGKEQQLVAQAKGITRQNNVQGNFSLEVSLVKNQQKVDLEANHFPTLVLDQTLAIANPKLSGLLLQLFGDSLQITIHQNTENEANTLKLVANSPFIKVSFAGKIEKDLVYLEPNGSIDFNVPEENGDQILTILGLKNVHIKRPLAGKLTTGPLIIPLNSNDVQNFSGQGHITLQPNQFQMGKDQIELAVLKAEVTADASNPKMKATIKVQAVQENRPFSFDLSFLIPKFALFTSNLDMIMSEGIGLDGNFNSQTPFIESKWHGILKETHSELDLSFLSDRLTLPSVHISVPFIPFQEIFEDGEIDSVIQGQITAYNPKLDMPIGPIDEVSMPWILDVKENSLKLNLVAKNDDPELKSAIKGSLRVDDFIQETGLDRNQASLQLNLKLDQVRTEALQPYISPYPVKRVFGPALDMEITLAKTGQEALEGCIEVIPPKTSNAFIKRIYSKFEIQKHDITFQTETQQALGATQFMGTFQNVFNHQGHLDLGNGSFCVQGNLKHFPVGILAKLISGDEKVADTMEAILGSQVEGDIHAEMINHQGPVHVHLKGLNGQCEMDGKIVDSVLLLNKPITASLKVTPQLEHAVLREYLPILGSVVEAEKPIELSIPVAGFKLPLKSPSLADLQFQQAELKLDKMLFVKDGPLGKIVSVLGVQAPKFIVWFTPIYFSMEQGTIAMHRADMLVADTYPLAAWGNVNLNSEELDLTIALSEISLKNAFNIETGNWFKIPVRGSLHHPKIDLAVITTYVASLTAASKAGAPGKFLGSVIEKAADFIAADPIPDPSTSPLPWQTTSNASKESNPDALNDLPVDDLKKEAKKLFKGLFNQ